MKIILALFGFALLTIVTTYPLIWHMGSGIYGFPGDSLGTIWEYWRNYQDLLNKNFPSYFSDLLGAPFGSPRLQAMLDPHLYEGLLLTILTNEVVAYNLMVMLGIWASAFVAYLLAKSLWQNQWAAILSGVVFGFCPSLAMSAGGHMGFTHLQWMPLYLLSLFYFKRKQNWLSAILCGIALSIVVVTNYYIGYITTVATTVFVACWAYYSVRWKCTHISWKPVGLFLLAMLTGTMLSLPWTWPIVKTILFENVSDSPIATIAHRPFGWLYLNSARPWDYFLPPIDHPVLGNYTQTVYSLVKSWKIGEYLPGFLDQWFSRFGNTWGQMYLGWTPLGLAIYGLITAFRRRKGLVKHSERFALIFFGILFGVTVWFAMPPEFPIGELARKVWPSFPDWRMPTPSYFLYNLLPMFRRYAVFGVATILAVALLAGFGMRELLLRTENRWKKAGAISLIFGLVFFEFLHEPRHVRFPPIPQEYAWLARQPEDIIIAEYPFTFYPYGLFFQCIHGRRVLNAWGNVPVVDKAIGPSVVKLSDPLTPEKLGALGVRYVLLHTSDYFGPSPLNEGQPIMGISKPLNRTVNGLNLIKETPTAQIFEVSNNSALMMVYPDPNARGKKPWLSNKVWKWQSDTQRLYIMNAGDKPIEVTFSAKSPQAEGEFRVIYEQDNDEGFRQLRWNNGRILIPGVECAGEAEAIIEVSFPNKIDGEATVWSDWSVDAVPRNNLVMNGTFSTGSHWKKQAGWEIANGAAIANKVDGSVNISQKIVTTLGKYYKVSYSVTNYEGGAVATYFGFGVVGMGPRHRGEGTYADIFKARVTSTLLQITGWDNLKGHIDNVTCFEVPGPSVSVDEGLVKR